MSNSSLSSNNSSTVAVDNQALTLNRCVGKKNYHLSKNTNWYGLQGVPVYDDTRCEYCVRHMSRLNLRYGRQPFPYDSEHNSIDCDSLSDYAVSGMRYKDFVFQIIAADGSTPMLVHPEDQTLRDHGVLVVEMPEKQDYMVKIQPVEQNSYTYYTFTMKVGDRDVVINNGKKIYYRQAAAVLGFQTGATESFKFVADTPSNGESKAAGANSNVITIRIDRYKNVTEFNRISFISTPGNRSHLYPPGSNWRSLGLEGSGKPRGISKSGFIGYSSRGEEYSHRSLQEKSGREPTQEEKWPLRRGEAHDEENMELSSSSVTGGRTESGNQYTPNVNTTTTSDEFKLEEVITATIKLIHVTGNKYQAVIRPNKHEQLRAQADLLHQQALEEQRRLLEQSASTTSIKNDNSCDKKNDNSDTTVQM
jgi:hypothetical protein